VRVEAPGRLASLWLEGREREPRPRLSEDLRVDVAVLGAGLTGLTAACLLAQRGTRVAVLEARTVGAGASGYNTAKLSSLHGLVYTTLEKRFGADRARLYAEANEAGIALVRRLRAELDIDCDLATKANLTYTESPSERDQIRQETDAARRAGLLASYVEDTDLPFGVAAAVRLEDQAEFHPVKYIDGLAREVGDQLYERTRAVSVKAGSPCRVRTEDGAVVTADHVIVATGMPILDRGLYFARTHPERSYVVAARTEAPPQAMYISTEQPSHSLRAHGDWLIVLGGSHKTGQADGAERYRGVAAWMRERFGLEAELRWATQDYMPMDGVPYVGRLDPVSKNLWVATGYRKWGLAMGGAAAVLLAELVEGRDHAWKPLFDPQRRPPLAGLPPLLKEGADDAFHELADRLTRRADLDDIPLGEGRVVGAGLGQRAVHRDAEGRLHVLSARCTHLGCIVRWNSGDGSWDCPCHGSRFGPDGEVLQGPAVRSLQRRPLAGE
jgi:glycine/D-amino acid oxidase-like deaminating enzyme/nitrite reductase/ring-hydroxylating ferredoxin subunit